MDYEQLEKALVEMIAQRWPDAKVEPASEGEYAVICGEFRCLITFQDL